ncbi:MAG: hypothetical protein ACRCX2_01365, partial [Paraclostridium sp.]
KTKQEFFGELEVRDVLEVSFFGCGVKMSNLSKGRKFKWIKTENFDATIEKMEDKGFRYEEFEEGREYVEM